MITTSSTPTDDDLNLVRSMIEFVSTGNLPPLLIYPERLIGKSSLRLICISLLSWLKARNRFPRMTVAKEKEFGSAFQALKLLLSNDEPFARVFSIKDAGIALHEDLSAGEIDEITSTAANLYQPPRFLTQRQT